MDHMRISGTEPSSVILSQTKYFKKLKNDAQKLPKQLVKIASILEINENATLVFSNELYKETSTKMYTCTPFYIGIDIQY